MHHEEFGDRLLGVLAGYLLYSGLVTEGPHAIVVIEKITGRQLGAVGREIVAVTVNEGLFRDPLSGARAAPAAGGAGGGDGDAGQGTVDVEGSEARGRRARRRRPRRFVARRRRSSTARRSRRSGK